MYSRAPILLFLNFFFRNVNKFLIGVYFVRTPQYNQKHHCDYCDSQIVENLRQIRYFQRLREGKFLENLNFGSILLCVTSASVNIGAIKYRSCLHSFRIVNELKRVYTRISKFIENIKNQEVSIKMVDYKSKFYLDKAESYHKDSPSTATIDTLDDDCLIHIFELLSIADKIKVERVCRRWQTVSLLSWHKCRTLTPDKITWGLKKENGNLMIDANAVHQVLKRCGFYLKSLEFFGYLDDLVTLGNKIGSLCPNLESIYLCGVSSLAIQNLSENCTNIRELGLRDVFEQFDNELSSLFEKNKYLMKITFYSLCGNSEGKFFLDLPFESLKTLSIFNCDFLPFYVNQGIRKLKHLSKLSFDYCENFDDDSMEAICSLKSLEEIHMGIFPGKIKSCKCMTSLNNLMTVELSSSNLVNNELILALCNNCHHLTDINISESRVTDEGIHCVTSLPYLQRLNISHLKVHDEAIHPMPNLKQFECFMCQDLTDRCFSVLLETSKNLDSLNVGCCNVTNATAKKAVDVTKLRKNNVVLYMYIWGTKIKFDEITETSPLLRLLRMKKESKAKKFL